MNKLEKLEQNVRDAQANYVNARKALDVAYVAYEVAIDADTVADTAFELATNALTEYLEGQANEPRQSN